MFERDAAVRISRDTTTQTNRITADNARLQTSLAANLKLADLRQAWINSLRDDMAAFQSYGVTPDLAHRNEQEFYRLGTRIELFMNLADPDYPELQDCLYASLAAETIDEKFVANPTFVAVCQRILKREWDAVRRVTAARPHDGHIPTA